MSSETLAARRWAVRHWDRATARPGRQSGPWDFVRAAFDVVMEWQERAQTRHALRLMDEHMLRDMGVTRADVEQEAAKPFWRA